MIIPCSRTTGNACFGAGDNTNRTRQLKTKLLDYAINAASNGLKGHRELGRFMHWSFVVVDNHIVGYGTNATNEPPRHWGYHRDNDKGFRPKMHSEISAFRRCRYAITDRFEIINVRLNRRGEVMLSKPCQCCHHLLTELGCSCFWYSSNCGFMRLETIL